MGLTEGEGEGGGSIEAIVCGPICFDWNYATSDCDGPAFDPFGYMIDGNPVPPTVVEAIHNQVLHVLTLKQVRRFRFTYSLLIHGVGLQPPLFPISAEKMRYVMTIMAIQKLRYATRGSAYV